MVLTVKDVKACKNGAWGNFVLLGRGRARITISLKKNQLLAEYGATLLHELLHFFMTSLRLKGVRVKDTTEHRFIYAVEAAVLNKFRKHLRRKSNA